MLYVPNYNTHPDVREHLWLRASGASQYTESYDNYRHKTSSSGYKKTDYYSGLEASPSPPNPSVGTIKAD